MLPEAEVAFLDEVFLGSTAILNTLLGLLNERVFRRGPPRSTVPLRVCVGACNALPDDPALAAFADRFLVRVFVEPVPDARLEELLETGWAVTASGRRRRPTGAPSPPLDAARRHRARSTSTASVPVLGPPCGGCARRARRSATAARCARSG